LKVTPAATLQLRSCAPQILKQDAVAPGTDTLANSTKRDILYASSLILAYLVHYTKT